MALKDEAEKLDNIRNLFMEGYKHASESFKQHNSQKDAGNGQKNNAEAAVRSSGINFSSKDSYTSKMQNTIDGYLEAVDEKLLSFIKKYQNNPTEKFSRLTLSEVSEKQAKDLKRLLGIDFEGYSNAINKNAIIHINKRHGINGQADNSMSNSNDFARLGFVIENYDDIEVIRLEDGDIELSKEFRNSDNTPANLIRMKKKVNGTYYVVEAVAENKYQKIWVASAYIKSEPVTQVPTTKGSGSSLVSPDSDNIISEDSESVKQDFSTKDTSPIQAHYAEVLRENNNLRQIISALDEMNYSSARKEFTLNSRDIFGIASKLIKQTSSKYDKKTLADELTVLYDYMANNKGTADSEEILMSFLSIANGVLEQSETKDSGLWEQYKNVREFLKAQEVYITPQVKKEIASQFGDYKSFRNRLLSGNVRRFVHFNAYR